MDERAINGYKELLRMTREEHDRASFKSSESLKKSLSNLREAEKEVADFISPQLDGEGRIDISGWKEANHAIMDIWDCIEPVVVQTLLPNFVSSQAKRRRVEIADYWVFRPFFRHYEEEIFGDATNADGTKGLFGLNGPQGFGKSVFLHCLALKRAFDDNLVVWVPSCPPTLKRFKEALSRAFYCGCQAHGLTGMPYMKQSDSVSDLLDKILKFAQGKEKKLLVIVDQMNRHLPYFDDLKSTLVGFSASAALQGHRVLMSSSTSGTTGPIFGDACFDLKVFDHFISADEMTLLKARYQNSANLDLMQDGEWSFLHAVNILSEPATSVDQKASEFTSKLGQQFAVDSYDISVRRKAEYMSVLHMAVEGEEASWHISFDPHLVDGDLFFVKKQDDGMSVICEFMPGFAHHVLQRLKARSNYEEYLRFVIGSSHFQTITRGAQGSILEDAISYLLQKTTQPIKFALTGLGGGRGACTITSILLDRKRHVQKFTTVPDLNDLQGWNAESEWYVGIPPEGFTGIDFVLARTRSVGANATKKLEIFFIQSTVSTPQDHGVKKSTEQRNLIKLFRDKVGVTDRNTTLFVTFLTPNLGNGIINDKMQYDVADYYHSKFQELEGNDPLVKIISEKFKVVWGA